MGIRIISPQSSIQVIEPFAAAELRAPVVRCMCDVQKQEHNLVYDGKTKKKSAPGSLFIVEFSLPTFRVITKAGNEAIRKFGRRLKGKQQIAFSDAVLSLDAAMHQCIYDITHCTEEKSLEPMYLYARVVDLLRLQQLSFIRANTRQHKHVKTEYDKERIVYARDYLLTHMDAPPTLTKLAAIAGINEFKLKQGFREIFNHTVFGYLADVRLEMAKTALRKKEKPITQIAFELGYASLQHFSMAFKKKFGVSPRGWE